MIASGRWMPESPPNEAAIEPGHSTHAPGTAPYTQPEPRRFVSLSGDISVVDSAIATARDVAFLRREIARLERELAEARSMARAGEAIVLGKTLLVYVLDVLCTLLQPQRGQAIILDTGASSNQPDARDGAAGVGPLQMVLERPSWARAVKGQVARATTRYESVLWLPVPQGAEVAAILCLRRSPRSPFSQREQELGTDIGALVLSALQTGDRRFDLHQDQEALHALDITLGDRIRAGGGAVAAQARDAERLAQRFNLDAGDRLAVRLGAILHDIGTVDLAEEILRKDGPLTSQELSQLREHSAFGAEIVRQFTAMEQVIPIVLHHHEQWDGSGYPGGLAAEAIPLGARIVAVVDAFHAMINRRLYRQARSVEEALDELSRCAGRQFDARVVEEFTRMVRDDR